MNELRQTFGFNGYALDNLAQKVSQTIKLPARTRDNSYWGKYFCFRIDEDHDHRLVSNEIPPGFTDPDEAAEPDFLDWKCIFWVAIGFESEELTASLLSIEGAALLRPKPAF